MPRREGTPPHGETPGIYIPEVKVAFKAWSLLTELMPNQAQPIN